MSAVSTAAPVVPLDGFPSPAAATSALGPVEVEILQRCHFKAKTCGSCGKPKSNAVHRKKNIEEGKAFCAFKRRNGCANCGLPKKDRSHFGSPPAFRALGSGDPLLYQSLKQQWEELLTDLLTASALPKGLAHVTVEGEATFPDSGRRDQGNYRVLIEKALGDALTAGGWLADDDWTRYEFGGLAYRYEKGVSRTRLMLFPRA